MSVRLEHPPIVEAVVDIDCDLPPGFNPGAMEALKSNAFGDGYPDRRQQLFQEHLLALEPDQPPALSARTGLQAVQYASGDGRQLVQIRKQGFSFNRLAPYTSLDDLLPEIERSWRTFAELTGPLKIGRIGLRYINRICLPLSEGQVLLEDFLKVSPRLPEEANLTFTGFLRQHAAIETETGNEVTLMLASQAPEKERLPLIFDIEAWHSGSLEPDRWDLVLERIVSLRSLKNRVFHNTLTSKCLNLFQPRESSSD